MIKVEKSYSDLDEREIGPFGCTPCEVDQETIELPFAPPFKVCKKIAEQVKTALLNSFHIGFPINEVIGYRPSFSKGEVDYQYNRTELSYHSFGTAIDINPDHNGLYSECIEWNEGCKLIKGGPRDLQKGLTIQADSPIVYEMKKIGLKWGGEILGKQKDFMHFSPSGY